MTLATIAPTFLDYAVAPQLHKHLRDRIITCNLAPAHRISETEIASSLIKEFRQSVRKPCLNVTRI